MGNDNTQGIRISLPPETVIQGSRDKYTIKKFICMSERSTTALCESVSGDTYRLKLYNGQHSINNAIQRQAAAVQTGGVLKPVDIGVFSGCPFSVCKNVDAVDARNYPISQNILVNQIIPQLAYVVNKYHQSRILLRDISPDNILYNPNKGQIVYIGFNNMTALPDKATITKSEGYGQHVSFVAPEVAKYGYSTCSDYYSLGVTILSLMLGKNPMENMSGEEIQRHLRSGNVPGIDVNHLKSTPYELYSFADKVSYLILGLMLPNPKDRWGYGEIRCWCNNQHIPLVRKEGRIPYQYNAPFIINGFSCWNYKQLSEKMAMEKSAWSDEVFGRLDQFAKQQGIANWDHIVAAIKEPGLTQSGKAFRIIYGINPALDGLWWEGKKYANTEELVTKAVADTHTASILSQILKNHCLSYFLKMRKRVSSVSDTDINETEQIEQWEIADPGKGVNRCAMRFAGNKNNRIFYVEGREYSDLSALISGYGSEGLRLKSQSAAILKDKGFQAWLWANGLEAAGTKALQISKTDPEQSFFTLLKLAESTAKDEAVKRLIRLMYITYGEYAPICWLLKNLQNFNVVAPQGHIEYDALKKVRISADWQLDRLSFELNKLVPEYQRFVAQTASSPFDVECFDLSFSNIAIYPRYEDMFFSCKWDYGLNVCPRFLYDIGENVKKKELDEWILECAHTIDEQLDNYIKRIPSYGSNVSEEKFKASCNTNIALCIAAFVFSLVCFVTVGRLSIWGIAGFFISLIFPIIILIMFLSKKARAGQYYKKRSSVDVGRRFYQQYRDNLKNRGMEIVAHIYGRTPREVTIIDKPSMIISDSIGSVDSLDIPGSFYTLGAVSSGGFFLMQMWNSGLSILFVMNVLFFGYLMYLHAFDSFKKWLFVTLLMVIPVITTFVIDVTIIAVIVEVIAWRFIWKMLRV